MPSTSYIQKVRNRLLCLLELKLVKNVISCKKELVSWAFQVWHFPYLLPSLILICMSSLTLSSSNQTSTFLNQYVFSLCVTAWSHIFQKRLHSSASFFIPHFLFVSLSIRWTISSGLIQISDSTCAALSYSHIFLVLFQQQLTSVERLREPLQHLSAFKSIFFQALIWRFCFAVLSILFDCPNFLCNVFCFSKTLFCQFGSLFPVMSLFL